MMDWNLDWLFEIGLRVMEWKESGNGREEDVTLPRRRIFVDRVGWLLCLVKSRDGETIHDFGWNDCMQTADEVDLVCCSGLYVCS